SHGVGEHEHGIDASHLRVYRYWFFPAVGGIKERFSTGKRTGKSNRFDQRMTDQGNARLASGAVYQRESTRGHSRFGSSTHDRTSHQLRGTGMRSVAFHHHRASGSQRGSNISTCGGKGQRKVACLEHRYGAEGSLHLPNVRSGGGNSVRNGRVDPRIDPGSLLHHLSKELQLVDGAG